MKTQVTHEEGRFKSLVIELEDMSELDKMDYIFTVLEQNIDINKAPLHFEHFYTNLFKPCQQLVNTKSSMGTL